jgi:signal peptidase II
VSIVTDGARRAPELWLSAAIIVADQVTKALVRAKLPLYGSVNLIPGMLDITHATNNGAAFGILNGVEFPYKAVVMVLVALIALAAVGLYALALPA